ncbi:MAG: hypothetical protein JWP15_3002, partial [Alphaproteobacteria bacterium]|nr:hypothetical protein [Alphaproteobacteria bacterium]
PALAPCPARNLPLSRVQTWSVPTLDLALGAIREASLGAWGAIVMGFFGSLFAALTLHFERGWTGIAACLPFVLFAAIAIAEIVVIRRPAKASRRRIGRSG